ncbi:hypothetical protein ACFQH9_02010 [Pseudonocardia lutea]|uniref:Uncharacterized protein n=1 Tax=Pseudonocardia lutea TaxID=2172015 RepID=A0ABW1I320_9PSEU
MLTDAALKTAVAAASGRRRIDFPNVTRQTRAATELGSLWIWAVPRDHYVGGDRPSIAYLREDEWACAPETRTGDLAMLLRPDGRDLEGVLVATSAAYIVGAPYWKVSGSTVCRFAIVGLFSQPVPLRALGIPKPPPFEPAVRVTASQWHPAHRLAGGAVTTS